MKILHSTPLSLLAAIAIGHWPTGQLQGAELVKAKDGSGVYGYNDTPVLPWCGYRVHDADRPNPKRVKIGPASEGIAVAPADATVLFDGKDLAAWQLNKCKLVDGCIEAG